MSTFKHAITHAPNGDLLINSSHHGCDYSISIRLNEELPISSLNNIIANVESTMINYKMNAIAGLNNNALQQNEE